MGKRRVDVEMERNDALEELDRAMSVLRSAWVDGLDVVAMRRIEASVETAVHECRLRLARLRRIERARAKDPAP
jgi:hypothetical protein